jgi:hypothetical protein
MSNTKIEEFISSLPNWEIYKSRVIPVGWDPCPDGYDILSLDYQTSDGYISIEIRYKDAIDIFDQTMLLTPTFLKELIKINDKFDKLMQYLEVTSIHEGDFT